jgi:hypothetical protein
MTTDTTPKQEQAQRKPTAYELFTAWLLHLATEHPNELLPEPYPQGPIG